jgi:hypothetical protein
MLQFGPYKEPLAVKCIFPLLLCNSVPLIVHPPIVPLLATKEPSCPTLNGALPLSSGDFAPAQNAYPCPDVDDIPTPSPLVEYKL